MLPIAPLNFHFYDYHSFGAYSLLRVFIAIANFVPSYSYLHYFHVTQNNEFELQTQPHLHTFSYCC